MPRLGSLTQGPGRCFSRQMGACQWPLADFGLQPYAFGNGPVVVDVELGSNVQIGHFAPAPITLRTPRFYGIYTISGTTRDSTGAALGACRVDLFKTDAFDTFVASTTSDGSGNFSFSIGQNAGYFFIVAYKSGSPDVAGTTANTLTAA